MAKSIKELQNGFAQAGTVTFISIRPKRLAEVIPLKQVRAVENVGLEGDRYRNKGGSRQVTLIQQEHLEAISSFLGRDARPEMIRRNLVIRGINLLSLKNQRFKVGHVILEYSGECHPCSRMEATLASEGIMRCVAMAGSPQRLSQVESFLLATL